MLIRHDGLLEIIDDRRNGWLVDEHAVPELAAAIRELATDPALRTAIGCAAWKTVHAAHSHDAVRPQVLRLLGLTGEPSG